MATDLNPGSERAELSQLITEFQLWRVRFGRLMQRTNQRRPSIYFVRLVANNAETLASNLRTLEDTENL